MSNQDKLWTPGLMEQYENIRADLLSNYNNAYNVLNTRWVAAALDYNNAKNEINTAKNTIEQITIRLASETDKLKEYLSRLNEINGPKILNEISEKEFKLRKLEKENNKIKEKANFRNEQSTSLYNKYEGNQHEMNYPSMPWEIQYSTWYSWSPYSTYLNLNPAARSGILFLGFFFGFIAIIALGAKAAFLYYSTTPTIFVSRPTLVASTRPDRRF